MRIINKSKNTVVAERAYCADTAISRIVGLLNRSSLGNDEALIITQCRSIHTFFMRFPIDVVFMDRQNFIAGLVPDIQPFQMSPCFWKASYVIEMVPGAIQRSLCSIGDEIVVEGADQE